VAARDLVGNAGTLSELACASPKDVIDFFENYRDAGGMAGGGICSIDASASGRSFSLGGAGVALAGLALLRRRAARRRSGVLASAPTAKEPR
jgi:hypothetical protein